jgi:hypothetical protein
MDRLREEAEDDIPRQNDDKITVKQPFGECIQSPSIPQDLLSVNATKSGTNPERSEKVEEESNCLLM